MGMGIGVTDTLTLPLANTKRTIKQSTQQRKPQEWNEYEYEWRMRMGKEEIS
jgi:hypothetical protein